MARASLDDPVTFSKVQNLTGGNNGDTFTFEANGLIKGDIRGGPGATDITSNANPLTLVGSVLTTGDLTIEGASITVGPAVTISSRQIGGGDPATAASTGDSGSITITSPSITFQNQDAILANVEPGSIYTAGDVTLDAEDHTLRQTTVASPVAVSNDMATISITTTTIAGGNIAIMANAGTTNIYDSSVDTSDTEYSALEDTNLLGFVSQIPGMALSSITGISGQVDVRQANATIDLDSSSVTGSGTVSIGSTALADSSLHTVSLSGIASKGAFELGVGYGEADTTATTTLTGSTVTGNASVAVTSNAVSSATVISRTASNLTANTNNKNTVAMAFGVAVTNETSHVTVGQGSTVKSVLDSIDVDAEGDGAIPNTQTGFSPGFSATTTAMASPTINQDGTFGLGVTVSFDTSNIKTEVDGTLDAKGGAANTFNADPTSGQVHYSDSTTNTPNSITIPGHGFTDGEAVTYSNGGGPDIGGLTGGDTYYVQVLDPDTIQLAAGRTLSLGYALPAGEAGLTPTQSLGLGQELAFGSSAVMNDEIAVADSSIFTPGQAVTYIGTASVPDANGVEQDSGVGGLTLGATYYVIIADSAHIELASTVGGSAVSLTPGVGTHYFAYQANPQSFNPATAVSNVNNTITFQNPDGFHTGDMVIYHTDPSITYQTTLNGAPVTEIDAPVAGLADGQIYYVVVINATTIRLATSLAAAQLAVPIVLMPAMNTGTDGFGSKHSQMPDDKTNGNTVQAGKSASSNGSFASTELTGEEFSWTTAAESGIGGNADEIIAGSPRLGSEDRSVGGRRGAGPTTRRRRRRIRGRGRRRDCHRVCQPRCRDHHWPDRHPPVQRGDRRAGRRQ